MKRPRLSLKQLFAGVAVASVIAWCVAGYESWYGVRWTQADAALLKAELASLDGEITDSQAVRIAIDAAVSHGATLRLLPDGVRRDVWTRRFKDGELVDPADIDCYIVFLEHIPDGISGAFTRIFGGHCMVYVGLDGEVLAYVGGA